MKKLVVGAVLAAMSSVCFAQVMVPMPITCDVDIPAFQKMVKDRKMVSTHESLVEISTGVNVALQVFTNPSKETITMVWLDSDQLCVVGAGAMVDIAKLRDATRKKKKPVAAPAGKYSA